VVAIGGDGIGPEVTEEAIKTLEHAGFAGSWVEAPAGRAHWLATGEALPDSTLSLVALHGLCLFGATTSGPASETESLARRHRLRPWRSPILHLRQALGLDIALRPARSFPGNPGNAIRLGADGGVEEPAVDLVVVRQNTEGLYAGVEWHPLPEKVAECLAANPRWNNGWNDSDTAITVRVVTRRRIERLVAAAFAQAERRGEDRIVLAEKPNVLRATSGLVVDVAREMANRHQTIELDVRNVDEVLMGLCSRPDAFGVIATTNLFGDLLSDAAAGLVGGPGFAPSANLGESAAVFEPVHGSAPDIAGGGTANPVAAILAAAMLAEHVGQGAVDRRIRTAVERAVAGGLPTGTGAIGRTVRAALE
jgi:isocitrate dehydrogenase (NAD+)